MKKTFRCPKCSSKKLSRIKHSHPSKVTLGVLGKARISKYICLDCGFIEEWIEYEVDLKKINREYGENL